MNLHKAIDINVELKAELIREGRLEKAQGVQLGIEALNHVLDVRRFPELSNWNPLPSEAKH